MSFSEAIQDWWDSRDVRKIRRRRRKKAEQYLKSLKRKEEEALKPGDKNIKTEDYKEKRVISLKNRFILKGDFFATTFEKGYKWGVIIVIGVMVIVGFLLVLLFSSDMFSVSGLEYKYNESLFINDKLIDVHVDPFIGENIFLLDTKLIEEALLENFQTVSNVEIDKLYPKTLLITIHEFKPALILRKGQSEDTEYLINQAGVVVATRPYSGVNAEYVTVLTTDMEFESAVGDKLMDAELVDFFYRAESLFEDKVGIPVISIWWLEREQELHMWTQKYFKVMISLNRPVEDQIEEMIIALQESDIRKRDFEYIDLRIKDKIFVKPR